MAPLPRFALAAALLALAAPAAARDARKADLTALAGVLGESQALREVCQGKKDPYWRSRMARLLSVEELEGPEGAALTGAFHAAYAHARAEHPTCTRESRQAEHAAAARGQELAAALAAPVIRDEPEAPETPPIAEPPGPR